MSIDISIDAGSFRDPAGFIFIKGSNIYRQINKTGKDDYELLMQGGLYDSLVTGQLIVKHKETHKQPTAIGYKIIQPELVPFITYPYEWSFSQLKDAALLTLKVEREALKHGMELKDASAYNVQFINGKPVLIDTLSFQKYKPGRPWQAYRQFCQHFLSPLALMSYTDLDLAKLMRVNIDGIPLALTKKLLPKQAKIRPGIAMHISMHARSQNKYAGNSELSAKVNPELGKNSLVGIVDSLERTVNKLHLKNSNTEWADYYTFTNYADSSFNDKRQIVTKLIKKSAPDIVLDLGSNNGLFSRVAAENCQLVISADIDPNAVEENYLTAKSNNETKLLPMLLDLTNPSSNLGWAHNERKSLSERCKTVDTVMALALVHHLAISNNLPLERIADYFAQLAPWLIIEFVPKEDSQVNKLLQTREDIFTGYNIKGFEHAFGQFYSIVSKKIVTGTKRTVYLMKVKKNNVEVC